MSSDVPPPIDRRAAVLRLAAAAAACCGLAARPAGAMRAAPRSTPAHPTPPHPTPRAGVTAARVPTTARLRELGAGDAVAAFDEVRQIPEVADGIRCHCGCAETPGYRSLLSCYEGDAMARECSICQGQGRMAFRLARAGRTLDEVRAALDARYG